MRTNTNWTICLTIVTLMLTSIGAAQESEQDQDEQLTARARSNSRAAERERTDARETIQSRSEATRVRESDQDLFHALQAGIATTPQQLPIQTNLTTANRLLITQDALARNPFGRMNSQLATTYHQANKKLAVLVQDLKGADGEESKLEIKAEIKTLLDEKYDAYLEHHEAPLKQLEERLEKLRAEFESRKKAKDDLVKLRLDTIWYDAIGLGWPENQRGSAFSSTVRGLNFPAAVQPGPPGPLPNSNMRLPANPFDNGNYPRPTVSAPAHNPPTSRAPKF